MQSRSTKIESMLLAPAALIVTAIFGYALCQIAGWNTHPREFFSALIVIIFSIACATVPLFLTRRSDQATVAQAALISTIVHLFVAAALAAVMILIVRLAQEFTYWLFAFYWMSLIGLATAAVRC